MKVSTSQPYQIIYSLFKHEHLGYLFESFAIQVDSTGKLTLLHQNISHKNAHEFKKGVDEVDMQLITMMDKIQQDQIINKFLQKRENPHDFFNRVYDKDEGDRTLQNVIADYIEDKMAQILELLVNKRTFIMGKNGQPTWKEFFVQQEKASVLFHFRKNESNTHYFPTIKHKGQKIDFQYKNAQIICDNPAWMLLDNKLFSFEKNVDGKKLRPFLNKKFIVIPENVEKTYYKNFIAPLIESYDVYAQGFDIITDHFDSKPILSVTDMSGGSSPTLFDNKEDDSSENNKVMLGLSFKYGDYELSHGSAKKSVSVRLEDNSGKYTFHRIKRLPDSEKNIVDFLYDKDLNLKTGKLVLDRNKIYSWLSKYAEELEKYSFEIKQKNAGNKRYFIGNSSIEVEFKESNDWFDIYGVVKFGEFEIPFLQLKKYILFGNHEFPLPDGTIAIIPEEWFTHYLELFAFSDEQEGLKLKKHHISLVAELGESNLAKVAFSRKLEQLKNIEQIDDYPLPQNFNCELRPYQKAGYNWLIFLEKHNFGGCLADDMGLGKTVQTLALLQKQKEENPGKPSLLVLPTSLVYNWLQEAQKFTPNLRVMTYTSTYRTKRTDLFSEADIVITTYGVLRLDVDILKDFHFNYIILDESQNIKNPTSHISLAVRELKSRRKLILTGTPIENTTLDLWSQMSFINPGLLGSFGFFKKEFQLPIEKKADEQKAHKLNALVKPFILRRHKSQVASELPEKIEKIYYCEMTSEQEKIYEETKSSFRNEILKEIDKNGLAKSQILILKGLIKLRQIANHPKMNDPNYVGESGKLNAFVELLGNALSENHKILVFSQFVKHLDIVKSALIEQDIKFAYLDGSTIDRKREVELFQQNYDIKVFLISLKAGGTGLNLTAADYVFLLDPWWNPAAEAQAVDRAHRIGQKNTVFNYKFITKNSIEEKIIALQQKKIRLVRDIITVDEALSKSFNKEDIEMLLS